MQAATTEKPEAALEDVTPAIAGDYTPASSESSLDDLLAEFDRQVPKPEPAADTAQPNADATAPPQDDIESFLQGLGTSEDKQRADSLQGEVDSLRAAEHRRQELEAFESYCGDLQKQMPSHVPADYVRAKLEALAHNPEIALAWDLRGVDRSAAKIELQRVQFELSQLQRDPTADQARIAELNAYGQRLNIAVNSHAILRKATFGILNEAKKLAPPIDDEATAMHQDVAAAVRYASTTKVPEEGAPNFAEMDENTFREWTRKNVR